MTTWVKVYNSMPLGDLPGSMREEIERQVSLPDPPPKWLRSQVAQILSRAWVEWYRARGTDPLARAARGSITPRLRAAVITRDGYACQICGDPVRPDDVHLDHRLPLSRGGPTTLGNLQVAHSACNRRKGARIL